MELVFVERNSWGGLNCVTSGVREPKPQPPQLVVNLRHQNYDIYIGRGKCPRTGEISLWGNPFSHLEKSSAKFRVATREEAIRRYEEWILTQPHLMARLSELRGKVLGCWCYPQACHGSVLVKLANKGDINE